MVFYSRFLKINFVFGQAGSSLLHRVFSGYGNGGCSLVVECGLLLGLSPRRRHRLEGTAAAVVVRGLSACGVRACLSHCTQGLPGPGLDPVSPALQVDSSPLSHQGSLYGQFLKMFLHLSLLIHLELVMVKYNRSDFVFVRQLYSCPMLFIGLSTFSQFFLEISLLSDTEFPTICVRDISSLLFC